MLSTPIDAKLNLAPVDEANDRELHVQFALSTVITAVLPIFTLSADVGRTPPIHVAGELQLPTNVPL